MPREPATRPRAVSRVVVGLDLAGSPRRRTGFCRLGPGLRAVTHVLYEDEEILAAVRASRPTLVGIDAPLSLPAGRVSIDARGPPHLRACDRALRALGIPFFPVTLGPMRQLTARGSSLAARLDAEGFPSIEVYPGGAQDLLGLPRKGAGVRRLQRALVGFGFRGGLERRELTHDELDAIAAAYTSREHLARRSLVLGVPTEGQLVLPRPTRRGRGQDRSLRGRW